MRNYSFVESYGSLLLPGLGLISIIVISILEPRFLSFENLGNVFGQSAPLVIFAIAQMIPIITKGLDLSQGGVLVCTSVVFALCSSYMGTEVAAVTALIVGTGAGLTNGLIVAQFRVSPFVVTLGVGSVLSGVALILANGQPVYEVSDSYSKLYHGDVFGLPNSLIFVAIVALSASYFLSRTTLGRFVFAVGSNERAARLSGVPTIRATLTAYVVCGLLTSLGAILLSSRLSIGHPTSGADIALTAVAAAVIGGVSLFGGKGTVAGVILGALFLGLLSNALNLLNVASFSQHIAVGIAIIVAVIIDRIRTAGTNW